MAHIIFDIGGTKMRVAKKLSDTEFMQPKKVETPKDGKDGIRVLIEHAKECAGEEGIESMSGGIAGILNGTKIINSSNLTGWIGIDFAEVSEEYGFPVRVENDSSVVGLGEAHFGAGKGKRIVTYITVSTGVGGARIVEGEIDKSAHGFEPGHQIIDRNGFKTLEDLVSGRSLEERFSKKPYEIIEEEVWKELGLIYNASVYGDDTFSDLVWSLNITGNTNDDCKDQIGSNDGTVYGSPEEALYPV